MNQPIIEVKNLVKQFNVPHEKRETLKSYFINPFRRIPKEKFLALNNISFEIQKGEFVGLVGRNGSGKSTLLQIVAGIYQPTEGEVNVRGSLVPFLQLGVGFNPELSGRENIFLNGTILGMKESFLRQRFAEIVEFAEIEDFIDLQLKNYSSGMKIRLALAIAVQAQADIYLLDEVLAVGDESFRDKSLQKMRELLKNGSTVIYVSHSMDSISAMCSRTILLEDGEIIHDGDVEEGITKYRVTLLNKNKRKVFKRGRIGRIDDDEIKRSKVLSLHVYDSKDRITTELNPDETFKVKVKLEVAEEIKNAWLGYSFMLLDRPDMNIFGQKTGTGEPGQKQLPDLKAGDILEVEFLDKVIMHPGQYGIRISLGTIDAENRLTAVFNEVIDIKVTGSGARRWGLMYNDSSFNFKIKSS